MQYINNYLDIKQHAYLNSKRSKLVKENWFKSGII